jgi:hypothetical protein
MYATMREEWVLAETRARHKIWKLLPQPFPRFECQPNASYHNASETLVPLAAVGDLLFARSSEAVLASVSIQVATQT